MNTLTFEIPGEPKPKQRHRSGQGRTYTPRATEEYENKVRIYARNAMQNQGFVPAAPGEPVAIRILAYFQTRKKKPQPQESPCLKTPDWDNVGKIITDALNGIAYEDDRQIHQAIVEKRYGDPHRVLVQIETERSGHE